MTAFREGSTLEGIRLVAGAEPDASTRRQVERLRQRPLLSDAAWYKYDSERATILIPGSKFDYSQATALRIALRATLQTAVANVMGQTTVIRDLQAYDISGAASGAANYARLNNKNATVARTWLINDYGFRQVPVNSAVGIYGFVQMASIPLLDAIAFTQGGVMTFAQFALSSLYADQQSSVGYFDPPVVWKPQQSIGVNYLSESVISAAAEAYGLLGYVAEPAGQTVAPDQANLV